MTPQIQQLIGQAIECFQSGSPKQAEDILTRILNTQSNNLPALEILGLIKASQGNHLEAAKLLKKAIKLNPQNPASQYNLAKALSESKDYVGSLIHHEKALQLASNNPDGWLNYGQTLSHLKRHEAALAAFSKALSINSNYAEAWYNKALTLSELKRHEEALDCYNNTVQLHPNNTKAWVDMSVCLGLLKRFEEAIPCCDQALAQQPDYIEAWLNKGSAYNELKQFNQALDCYNQALELKHDFADAWYSKGVTLDKLDRQQEALDCYNKAIELDPMHAKAWLNKGNASTKLQGYVEALSAYDKAISLDTNFVEAWTNKAIPLYELKKYEDAIHACNMAIGIDPSYAESYWNKSIAQLVLGDFDAGWSNYEYRWKKNNPVQRLHQTIPSLSSLDTIGDKKILVWSEQGFGDTLQFARYIPKLMGLGAKVHFEVQSSIAPLLQDQFACNLITSGSPVVDVDFQIPLLSLPRLFGTDLHSIPKEVPYIKTSTKKMGEWKARLPLVNDRLNIGVACSGNANFDLQYGNKRTIPLSFFSNLANEHNLFLIQKEVLKTDQETLDQLGTIHALGNSIGNFEDSAAIVENMDLIISIDTSLAHLAGSLGKRVFILLPWCAEWRWLLSETTTPWYPTATLFRQPAIGDWASIMNQVFTSINSTIRSK